MISSSGHLGRDSPWYSLKSWCEISSTQRSVYIRLIGPYDVIDLDPAPSIVRWTRLNRLLVDLNLYYYIIIIYLTLVNNTEYISSLLLSHWQSVSVSMAAEETQREGSVTDLWFVQILFHHLWPFNLKQVYTFYSVCIV